MIVPLLYCLFTVTTIKEFLTVQSGGDGDLTSDAGRRVITFGHELCGHCPHFLVVNVTWN